MNQCAVCGWMNIGIGCTVMELMPLEHVMLAGRRMEQATGGEGE